MTLILMLIGFGVGTFGTLIGAGGGFILMPILLLLYPHESPQSLTAISLAVVFLNSVSGSVAYAFRKRVHYRSTFIFAIASAPGAFLGAYATHLIPRSEFEFVFGLLLTLMAVYLIIPRKQRDDAQSPETSKYAIHRMIDGEGHEHLLSYNLNLGILISLVVGFLSSFLGIGGGIIHVPALVNLLNFPVHIATATSHAILAFMSGIGVGEHVASGHFNGHWDRVLALAPGVIVGAQLGAILSSRVNGVWIIRSLSIALLSVGVRLMVA